MTTLQKAAPLLVLVFVVAQVSSGTAQGPAALDAQAQVERQAPAPASVAQQPDQTAQQPETPKRGSKRPPRTTDRPPASSRRAPEGSRSSRDAGPTRNELSLTGNVQGGYDDNVGASLGSGTGSVPLAPTSGGTGFADAMLEYFRGTSTRSMDVKLLANMTSYPGYLDQPAPAYKARFVGTTRIGGRSDLRFSTQGRYESMFSTNLEYDVNRAGAVDATDPATVLPAPASVTGAPNVGLLLQQSLVNSTKADFAHKWTRYDTLHLFYNFFIQRFTENLSGQTYNDARIEYQRSVGRSVALVSSYQYLGGEYADNAGVARPRVEHSVSGDFAFAKTLGGRRRLEASFSLGATYVSSVNDAMTPYDDWMPLGGAAATVDLTRTWSVGGAYQRSFTVLQGLTGQLYSSDRVSASAAGRLSSLLSLNVGGTYANGQTVLASGADETFGMYGASLGLAYEVSSRMALIASYFYYRQRYSNPAALPTGFPAAYDRNAFRVGLTFHMPLAGTSSTRIRLPDQW